MEFLQQRSDLKAFLNATIISKCFRARLWDNSKFVARQIDKIGPAIATALVNAGIVTFQKMESTNPRELELVGFNNRNPCGFSYRQSYLYYSQVLGVWVILEKSKLKTCRDRVYSKYLANKILYKMGYS